MHSQEISKRFAPSCVYFRNWIFTLFTLSSRLQTFYKVDKAIVEQFSEPRASRSCNEAVYCSVTSHCVLLTLLHCILFHCALFTMLHCALLDPVHCYILHCYTVPCKNVHCYIVHCYNVHC